MNPLYGKLLIAVNWQFTVDLYGVQHLLRNLDPLNTGASNQIFGKYVRTCLHIDCLAPSLEDCKFQFCHAAAKKCCGSGDYLICYPPGLLRVKIQA